MEMRAFDSVRNAMKSEKQQEKDSKPSGPMKDLVAKVQWMNQRNLTEADLEQE